MSQALTAVVDAAVPVIAVEGVTRRYGPTVALDGLSVAVPAGVTGLLGANGAGKTTLLRLVLGLDRPDAGRLQVLGVDPAVAGPEVRARLGFAPEHDGVPAEVTAQDLVRHLAEIHGLPRRHAVARASDTLHLVGLGEERLRPVETMSLGQRQRVKLAGALVHDPAITLLDEPTNGLDPLQRADMLALIRRVADDLGVHVIVSSHLVHEVEQVCDHVVILEAGRLRASRALGGAVTTADARAVEVEVSRDAQPTADALLAAGVEVVAVEGSVIVCTLTDDDHDVVRDVLAEVGAPLRRLQPRTATLTEQFFSDRAEDTTGTRRVAHGDGPPPPPGWAAPSGPPVDGHQTWPSSTEDGTP